MTHTVDIRDDEERVELNALLAQSLNRRFITPYIGLEAVRAILYHHKIFLPRAGIMKPDKDIHVFDVSQYGEKTGENNDGEVVTQKPDLSVVFEYELSMETGSYIVKCKVIKKQ